MTVDASDGTPPQAPAGRRPGLVRGVLAERVVISTVLDPFLDLKALAVYTSLSVRTLRTFINDLPPEQALPVYRVRGKLLVRRSEVDAWLGQFQTRGRPGLARALAELGLPAAHRPC